jgi:hypothetical protein
MTDLPMEILYPNDHEIKAHLAAGRYYGVESACGTKVKHPDFLSAHKAAESLSKARDKEFEAYPCYYCSPDLMSGEYTWHIGRAMTDLEWDIFYDLANQLLEMEEVTLNATEPEFGEQQGKVILRVHNRKLCEGRNCCIHNPSDHHMVNWEMNWRSDRRIMERICPHGVGHPDPDDAAFRVTIGDTDTIHGCDGCCIGV